ncbi:MAG: AraC family transcriptional regulator [Granulosicoccus sp.]
MDSVIEPSRVLASAADGVVHKINESGGDVDSIFGCANIRVKDLDSPFNELDLGRFCNLFEQSALQTGNEQFGLEFGANFQPRQLGAIGYAAISSPTLAAALRNVQTYFPAHQGQSTFQLVHSADILRLSYKILDPRIVDKRQDAELSLGMFLNIFRQALGSDWSPLEVWFEHEPMSGQRAHERVFGSSVAFGRSTNALAFRRSDLDAIMPESDPYLYSVIESFLKSRQSLRGNPVDFATLVRSQIKLQLGEVPLTLSEMARILGLSSHEFQRQLVEHGLSFRDLLAAAREELALHLLADASLPLTEVAAALGYSELSAFSRAFRKWTGMNPQRYRRHHNHGISRVAGTGKNIQAG